MSGTNIETLKVIKEANRSMITDYEIKGMGIGYKIVGGETTSDLSIVFMVETKLPPNEIPEGKLLPSTLEGEKCDVIEVGKIEAYSYTTNVRPILGGYSCGHFNVTAGTIGTIVYKNGDRHILSNNHILADENAASLGDAIYQPGVFDGGTAGDTVANLTDFIPLADYVTADCAIAKITTDGIASDVGIWGSNITAYTTPHLLDPVYKTGRTTESTSGVVLYTHVDVSVTYSSATYQINDCFVTGAMSSGGDSGSVCRTDNATACGLLFAGSASYTIYNYMSNVVSGLGITFTPPTPVASGVIETAESNNIFYPGISICQKITLTNDTANDITPHLYFDRTESDEIWWKTLRISPDCSGVSPSGYIDTYWENTIPASGTQDLYIRSICTKEGFSWKYKGSYWTNSGFNVINTEYINDNEEQGPAVDCDAAAAGSYLVLDTLTTLPTCRIAEEFVRVKFSVDGVVNAKFDIQYSDDNVTWTTVYTGADLSISALRKEITFWWVKPGAHRYWRLYKTDAAAAGANITEIQWLLFEAHYQAYDYGVYGDHTALLKDSTAHIPDTTLSGSVMINIDVFARQNYLKPIGHVGKRTKISARNFEKNGQTVQIYYIPAVTMSNTLNTKVDYQLEKRIWDIKAFITPQKRNLTYTAAADGLQPSLYRYDQRNILLEPFGPDKVGWYMTNYDFWHAYGHSYYILWDNHCYKIDEPNPIYLDDELVAFSARMFLQADMTTLATDPRNYVLTNREGLFLQYPVGGYSLANPANWVDPNTPEQRPLRWSGAYPIYVRARMASNRPNTYSLTEVLAADTTKNGEDYEIEEWANPCTTNFQTTYSLAFGAYVKSSANAIFFQMPRFYNWLGYADVTGLVEPFNFLLQLYYDEDCTIPVKLKLESSAVVAKVENKYNEAYVTAGGLVTLTKLGGTIVTDGHTTKTPSKLYVKYIAEDDHISYYYP